MLFGPTAFFTVLEQVRDANVVALRNAGDVPTNVAIVPGAIAWDNCDQCGLLALASIRQYLSDQFPNEYMGNMAPATSVQGAVLCADLAVQIIRCAPQPQDNQMAPTSAALEVSGKLVIADAYAIMCSTVETLTTLERADDIYGAMVRQQVYIGPAGACVGSELLFTVGVIR